MESSSSASSSSSSSSSTSPSSLNPNPNSTPPIVTLPPTTFVQADPLTFREVVQRLTGAPSGDTKLPVTTSSTSHRPLPVPPRRPSFKLQDRRPSARKLEIKLSHTRLSSFPSPYSPVTPLCSGALLSPSTAPTDEDRVIAERGFYLHPSPRSSDPNPNPPELLPLFPLTSPRHDPQQP